ncbi:MAG: hypothetical protein JSU72_03405 [Deltaproteobacteria bacterium]|nr:MAG: hypothetical protein JSU72_03405 [Deltaproteobacteria bacterium]
MVELRILLPMIIIFAGELVAAVMGEPLGWGRGLILIVLLMITGPATAHAIGSAANRIGLDRTGTGRDDLSYEGNPEA